MNLAKFPRRGYVTSPTPIEATPQFSAVLGNKVNVYIKRDDLLPGTAGGNKTRKLDFSIADALSKKADTITYEPYPRQPRRSHEQRKYAANYRICHYLRLRHQFAGGCGQTCP